MKKIDLSDGIFAIVHKKRILARCGLMVAIWFDWENSRAGDQRDQIDFYSARNDRIASAVLATAVPSVSLSVCPSHAGIVSKRRHVARCSLQRWIAKCV